MDESMQRKPVLQKMPKRQLRTVTITKYTPQRKKFKSRITKKHLSMLSRGIKTTTGRNRPTSKQVYTSKMRKIKSRQEEKHYKQELKDLKAKEKLEAKERRSARIARLKRVGSRFKRNKSIYR